MVPSSLQAYWQYSSSVARVSVDGRIILPSTHISRFEKNDNDAAVSI